MNKKKWLPSILFLFTLLLCSEGSYAVTKETANTAKTDEAAVLPDEPPVMVSDPFERFNRAMFSFNEAADKVVLKPVATLYSNIIPKPLQKGVHNFFVNIRTVPTIANDLLQFNFYQATNDIWRFGLNTTVGLGGLVDVASCVRLKPYENDFGLTLAKWGYKNSNYLVVPFWGPNTFRDAIDLPVDYFAFSVYPYIHPRSTRYAVYGVGVVDRRVQALKFQGLLDEAALDKYVFFRNAYMQQRAYEIEKNQHLSYKDRMLNQDEKPVAETPEAEAEALLTG
ncbi:MAG: hypothetical protein A3F14_03450 [Gammaproteobacteria bacterium RIFCSPHIGHO2_12_FULL_43_28]|nr:MAG: hypothetical protein A3F14_03450 [Gammaproteobacteria bacterium RIFCSPHIGHO2_12_FULL_43_28]